MFVQTKPQINMDKYASKSTRNQLQLLMKKNPKTWISESNKTAKASIYQYSYYYWNWNWDWDWDWIWIQAKRTRRQVVRMKMILLEMTVNLDGDGKEATRSPGEMEELMAVNRSLINWQHNQTTVNVPVGRSNCSSLCWSFSTLHSHLHLHNFRYHHSHHQTNSIITVKPPKALSSKLNSMTFLYKLIFLQDLGTCRLELKGMRLQMFELQLNR